MNPALALAGTTGLVLAGTIAWQLADWRQDPATLAPTRASATARPASPRLPDLAPQMAQASLARPLFASSRRPSSLGNDASPAAAPQAPLPRLTATLIWPGKRSAIFAGQPRAITAEVGARIAGFDIQSIEPGQVTLTGPDGIHILRTSFDTARPTVTAAAERPTVIPPGIQPTTPPPPISPGSAVPALNQAFPLPGPLPGALSGTSPPPTDAPQGGIPFEQTPSPSGLDIIRNPALQQR